MAAPVEQARQAAVERLVSRLAQDLRANAGIDMSAHLQQSSATVLARPSHTGTEERWAQVHAPS